MSDTKIDNRPGYMIYQEMCDEIYGKDAEQDEESEKDSDPYYLDTLNCGRDDLGFLGSFLEYMGGAL